MELDGAIIKPRHAYKLRLRVESSRSIAVVGFWLSWDLYVVHFEDERSNSHNDIYKEELESRIKRVESDPHIYLYTHKKIRETVNPHKQLV